MKYSNMFHLPCLNCTEHRQTVQLLITFVFLIRQMVKVGIVEQAYAASGKRYISQQMFFAFGVKSQKHCCASVNPLHGEYWKWNIDYFLPQETLMMRLLWAPLCSPPPLHKYHPHSRKHHPPHPPLPLSTPASLPTGTMRWDISGKLSNKCDLIYATCGEKRVCPFHVYEWNGP